MGKGHLPVQGNKPKPGLGRGLGQDSGQTDSERTQEAIKLLEMMSGHENSMSLNVPEREFLSGMLTKYANWDERLMVSGKQLFYLRDVKDKLVNAGEI